MYVCTSVGMQVSLSLLLQASHSFDPHVCVTVYLYIRKANNLKFRGGLILQGMPKITA